MNIMNKGYISPKKPTREKTFKVIVPDKRRISYYYQYSYFDIFFREILFYNEILLLIIKLSN